jgi:hypothetical protein
MIFILTKKKKNYDFYGWNNIVRRKPSFFYTISYIKSNDILHNFFFLFIFWCKLKLQAQLVYQNGNDSRVIELALRRKIKVRDISDNLILVGKKCI